MEDTLPFPESEMPPEITEDQVLKNLSSPMSDREFGQRIAKAKASNAPRLMKFGCSKKCTARCMKRFKVWKMVGAETDDVVEETMRCENPFEAQEKEMQEELQDEQPHLPSMDFEQAQLERELEAMLQETPDLAAAD